MLYNGEAQEQSALIVTVAHWKW